MQKIYVLLRNDQQTGPYSLEEIVQFNLKPYDLIWIEGKSAGWYYPQEIAALHPYLNFLPQKPKPAPQSVTAEKRVFVAMPAAMKKEEPQTAPVDYVPMYAPKETYMPSEPATKNLEEEVFAQFAKPEIENEQTFEKMPPANWQKKKSPNPVGVGIATVLIVGGVFAASWFMNPHSSEEENTTENVVASPAQSISADTTTGAKNNNISKSIQPVSPNKQQLQKNNIVPKKTAIIIDRNAVVKHQKETVANNPVAERNDDVTNVPAKEEAAIKKEANNAPDATTASQEKKKTLRDKILDIFRKKPVEAKSEEAKSSENENGERRSTHRESDANLVQMVSVRFDVPNDWMMGIKGAKATLANRSNETITKATVEILYYNDDNELLQKKVVTFDKIDAKDSQTISIPDHSTATRVDYNVVSVVGKPAA